MVAAIKRLSTASNDAKNLFGVNIIGGAASKIYENSIANNTAILKELTFCNTSKVIAKVTVAIKAVAEVMSLSNALFYQAEIAPGQTAVIAMSSTIANGKALFVAVDGTGTSLNVTANGVELLNATAKQLASVLLGTAYTSPYVTPVGKESVVYQIFAVNGGLVDVTLSVQLVPPSGVVDDKNCILYEVTIKPKETLMYSTKAPLPAGYKLYAKTSAANAVHMIVDGTEK